MNSLRATAVWLLAMGVACTRSREVESHPARPTDSGEPSPSPHPVPSPVENQPSIGSALMQPDGTIVLQLRAEDGTGRRGDALLTYPPAHPRYQFIREHLGGIQPGESKAVPPWPKTGG